MSHRRRISRLLYRLSLFVFGPYIEGWEATSQEDLDAAIDHGARDPGRPMNIVPGR